jgi:hypothetical protein
MAQTSTASASIIEIQAPQVQAIIFQAILLARACCSAEYMSSIFMVVNYTINMAFKEKVQLFLGVSKKSRGG